MAKGIQMSGEESLRRSHSGVSNFKLTLICLLCALSVSVFAAALATVGTGILPEPVLVGACTASGMLMLVSLWLISRFKR